MSKFLQFIAEEVKEALPATIFFLFAFHMVALTKSVLLEEYQVTPTGATVATVGALIVAKAILIIDKFAFAHWFANPRIYNILWRTLLFGLTALAFRIIEELIPLISEHGSASAAAADLFSEIHWPRFWVIQMWLFGLLLLYCTVTDLIELSGAPRVRQALFGQH